MPSIIIEEEDLTSSGSLIDYTNATVLVPGKANKAGVEVGDEFEFSNRAKFEEAVRAEGQTLEDIGFNMACYLLDLGMTVRYVVIDGYSSSTQSSDWWSKFQDRDLYDLRFITTGGDSSPTANQYAAETARNRGDAVALIHLPDEVAKDWSLADGYVNGKDIGAGLAKEAVPAKVEDYLADPARSYYRKDAEGKWEDQPYSGSCYVIDGNEAKELERAQVYVHIGENDHLPIEEYVAYFEAGDEKKQAQGDWPLYDANKNPLYSTKGAEAANLILGSAAPYAAGYVPNFYIEESGKETHVPGYMAYLGCFASYVNRFATWFAMAGAQRGKMPWEVSLDGNFGETAIDRLQDRDLEGHVALNPICTIRNYGDLVWGNRTMAPNANTNGVVGLTASSFLNIRMLLCDIKKHLYEVARSYTFDPNSSILWNNFYSAVVPLLEKMKSSQGIRGYSLLKTKTSKKATLTAVLRITPIEAVEDMKFTIQLADSVEVEEAA